MVNKKALSTAVLILNCESKLNYSIEFNGYYYNLYRKSDNNGFGTQIFSTKSKTTMYDTIQAMRTLLLVENQNQQTNFELDTKKKIEESTGYYVTCLHKKD